MTTDKDKAQIFQTEWNGILIQISWVPDWLNLMVKGEPVAHLEIETLKPPRTPLPMTNTGYLSHFTTPDTVNALGGPVAFVVGWLDESSKSPRWKNRPRLNKQLSLF